MTIRILLIAGVLISATSSVYAQIPVNSWRTHFSYYQAKDVIEVNNKIYCITQGGLCFVDKDDNTVNPLTKKDGLGGLNVTTMGFHQQTNTLLLGYADGTIDIIGKGNIRTIFDIQRKVTLINKRINSITFKGNEAYLACGFGIVIFDLTDYSFRETYFIGENNSELSVNHIIFSDGFIYAATENGLYQADEQDELLVDAGNWSKLNGLPDANANYNNLVLWQDQVLTAYSEVINDSVSQYNILQINSDGTYAPWNLHNAGEYLNLNVTNDYLVISNLSTVTVYDSNNNLIREVDVASPRKSMIDADGTLWSADFYSGLKIVKPDNTYRYYLINGPLNSYLSKIEYFNNSIYVTSTNEEIYDGPTSQGIYQFQDEKWENYYNFNTSGNYDNYFPTVYTLAADPFNENHYYASAMRYGLVEFIGQEVVNTYDGSNSALQIVDNTSTENNYDIRITGMDFDSQGNLWIAQDLTRNPISVKTSDGEWISVELEYPAFGRDYSQQVEDILVDQYDQKWLLLEPKGILVFKENDAGYESFTEKLMTFTNQEGTTMDEGYCLEMDEDGNVWVGTSAGPLVYYNTINVLDNDNDITSGNQIKIPRNDGTDLADILLSTVSVTDLAFDGANRMWVATANGGVFLISEDGLEEIHHFTTGNSPLISDNILSLDVNDHTGEVFIGTDRGILSYRAGSTKGNNQFGDVYVFPNPVKPGYEGDIAITNLALNANVKITDVSGNLVFETTALGSQAIWDGRDLWGNKVNTGVYLVFCVNEDGSETHVTKLLFVK
ncbi:MAG: hypothetical protein GVY19_04360 [Bacteroidetes bacterium]|nr:hypothetical protein [Bacteroidota bacterium]